MRVSMANIRDAAKMLAITPDAVAMTATATVNQTPESPRAGRAASASAKSCAAMISSSRRFPATAMEMARYMAVQMAIEMMIAAVDRRGRLRRIVDRHHRRTLLPRDGLTRHRDASTSPCELSSSLVGRHRGERVARQVTVAVSVSG
jgi:hypothetical protein